MADIRHKLVIKAAPEQVYKAVTTQEGIESWWCKLTTAKPVSGFTNVFVFGEFRNGMKVTTLSPGKKADWACIASIERWIGTHLPFDLGENNGHTVVRFAHGGWKAVTDTFAGCSYDWAIFIKSLKSFCETGTGEPR